MIFNEQTNTYKIEPMVIDGSPMSYEVKAYKIWYEDEPNNIYVGSTKRPLSERMGDHRQKVRQGRTSRIYNLMREKGVNDFKYVLLGTGRVSNFEQQRMFEEMWIKKLKPPLNMCKAYESKEELNERKRLYQQKPESKERIHKYRQRPEVKERERERSRKQEQKEERKQYKREYKQKPEYKEKQKEYRQRPEVKKRAKELVKKNYRICMCGSQCHSHFSRHINSQKHKRFMREFELELMKSK
jgi:hypothetical protein